MGQKVLIVDDEKEVRDLIAQYLKRDDLQVESAAGGREALDKLGLGADDYVKKPFSPSALSARVKAHLRRAGREGKGQKIEDNPENTHFIQTLRGLGYRFSVRENKLEN